MTFQGYLNACLKFAKDTENWSWLDRSHWFTTNGGGDYEESCDNANGGIDISWSFRLRADKVRAAAPQKFADAFTESLQLAIDNDDRDPDQLQAIVDLFT